MTFRDAPRLPMVVQAPAPFHPSNPVWKFTGESDRVTIQHAGNVSETRLPCYHFSVG